MKPIRSIRRTVSPLFEKFQYKSKFHTNSSSETDQFYRNSHSDFRQNRKVFARQIRKLFKSLNKSEVLNLYKILTNAWVFCFYFLRGVSHKPIENYNDYTN